MSNSISVCVGNRYTWDAVCLCVESILKRTTYPAYEIIVSDNSMAPNNRVREYHPDTPEMEDNGNRLEYLRNQASRGNIRLIENADQDDKYGHGENIKVLLKACTTDYALLFVSTAEILDGDWLDFLLDKIKGDNILGIAREKPASNHFDQQWIAPVYWPNIMLLDMRIYRKFGNIDEDWDLKRELLPDFKHPELFAGLPPLATPDHDPPKVFCDTGSRFWERVNYENPNGYRMVDLHNYFYSHQHGYNKIKLYSGIDRNSWRPQIKHCQDRFEEIKIRLDWLRRE